MYAIRSYYDRVKYAKILFDRVSLLPKDYDYILVGDFNSNRITSYNVCYTKLLREKVTIDNNFF